MNKTKLISTLLMGCVAALLAGCATGPRYSQIEASIPPLSQDNGRIYFYRTTVAGTAVQPSVELNGEDVGTAKPLGFFYVDRPPGDYVVTTTTEVKRSLSFTLDPGQSRYVRFNLSLGFFVGHVWPELIANNVAEKEIQNCHYMGK